ncbi:helix-turn-helix domain-containing protein [Streptomyces sp. NPDC088923]|uniref:helix-turn-helix domain-containing protein n=1 Tax=Streptomyces sp. NPDC088923 TaxID=3365913 RepID=UPI00381D2A65
MTNTTRTSRVKRLRNGDGAVPGRTGPAIWGSVLVHFRARAGKTQEELAIAINATRTHISRFESGDRVPDRRHAEAADRFLDANGALVVLWDQTDWYPEVEHPDWFERRAEMEAEATEIYEYASMVVPGLLQCEEYVRAIHSLHGDEEDPDKRVRARMSRQLRFLDAKGPRLVAVLDESCVRTVVGCNEVMVQQLAHLLELAQRPNITVQVARAASYGIARPLRPLSVLTMPGGDRWVYSESLTKAHFASDPAEVARHNRTYDVLRADALSARESATLLREAMEGYDGDDQVRTDHRPLGEEQLQRRQRRKLRGNRVRVPRPRRPRA